MNWADIIAERRATEAAIRGELSNLPGAGAPLDLSEDLLVPPEVRAMARTLKHAGYSPPEIAWLKAIATAEKALAALPSGTGNDAESVNRVQRAKALVTKIGLLKELQSAAS